MVAVANPFQAGGPLPQLNLPQKLHYKRIRVTLLKLNCVAVIFLPTWIIANKLCKLYKLLIGQTVACRSQRLQNMGINSETLVTLRPIVTLLLALFLVNIWLFRC